MWGHRIEAPALGFAVGMRTWQDWPRAAQSQGVFPLASALGNLIFHLPGNWECLSAGQGVLSLCKAWRPFLNAINLPLGSQAGVKYRMLLVCPGAGQDLLHARLWMHISYLSPEIYGVPEIYSACKTLLNAGLSCAMAIVWECFVSAGRKTGTALPEWLPGGKRLRRGVRNSQGLERGWDGPASHPGLLRRARGCPGKGGSTEGVRGW